VARHLGQAPPGVAGLYVMAAQVNVPAAGQLGQAPPGDISVAGPDVPVQPSNDPAPPQMVHNSSSKDSDPTPHKCYLIQSTMAPQRSKTRLLPQVFARHLTVSPKASHFLNHQLVSCFYLLTYAIHIGAVYLGVNALWESFISGHREVV